MPWTAYSTLNVNENQEVPYQEKLPWQCISLKTHLKSLQS